MKNTKLYSILCYFTWVGWLIAFFLSSKEDSMARHHLNQALVLNILSTVGSILIRRGGLLAVIGEILDLGAFVLFIIGFIRAVKQSDEPLPLIGNVHLID